MNFLKNLLNNVKEIIKAQRKYTDENILELVFSKEKLEPECSEELYIHKFLQEISRNLIRSNSNNKSIVNEEQKNQIPHFLMFLINFYLTLKEFLEKNKTILLKIIYNNPQTENSICNFIDNLITSNLNAEESFVEKFIFYFKNAFLDFLKRDKNEKISFLKFQEQIKEELNLNYFDIFAAEEIQTLSGKLIWVIYESINSNIIENLDSDCEEAFDSNEKNYNEIENLDFNKNEANENDDNKTVSSDLKFAIKSVNNLNSMFSDLDLYDVNECLENQIIFFEGFLLDKSINNCFDINAKEKVETTENINSTNNNCFNFYDFNFSFCCLISDDFFEFTKNKKEKKREEEKENKNNHICFESCLADEEIKEKLDLISIYSHAFSIKLLVSKFKVDNSVKNYLRKFEIEIIDRTPSSTYSEIYSLFEVKILTYQNLKDIETLKEQLLNNLLNYKQNKNYNKEQTEEEIFSTLNLIIEKNEINNFQIVKHLIKIADLDKNPNLNKSKVFKLSENFIILGKTNKKSNEDFLAQIKNMQKASEAQKLQNVLESNFKLFLNTSSENNFSNSNLTFLILKSLMKNAFQEKLLNNFDNANKIHFLKYKPQTILMNKFKGTLNEARTNSLNFILSKYSNLILDKLNNEENAEYTSKNLFEFKKFFFEENEIFENPSEQRKLITEDLILLLDKNIKNDNNKLIFDSSKDFIELVFRNLLDIIIMRYEKKFVFNYIAETKENDEMFFNQLKFFDKFLINERNINAIADALGFLLNN